MNFLFYISKQYSIPIIQPIVNYIKTYTKYNISFFISEKVDKVFPNEWSKYPKYKSFKEIKNNEFDFVIVPGIYVDFRLSGIKVQIFHGLGIEKESHYSIKHFFDIFLTSGPFVTKKFNKLQKEHKYFLVKETGWAKIDHILNYPTKNIKEKYSIPNDKKIILYAPTFSNKLESASKIIPNLPTLINENEFWLVKLHELADKKIIKLIENYDNVKLINDFDITPYLHIADIMISDISSVVYEFMALDKPVITYKIKQRTDKGINCENIDELKNAIKRSLKFPNEYRENRKKHLQEINPYLDGKISENIVKYLISVKENKLLQKKKKPLNIIRKLKILYHSKFKKGYFR
ncbi:MAG: CDP-glycerol glycerophosphotransferase family protein [Candidatus Marinimicrobia bacterium]|nr:CDP-glycerol glycerophosphotransferase family protein [Candidatus Neomarinimicrobiota bacterium]